MVDQVGRFVVYYSRPRWSNERLTGKREGGLPITKTFSNLEPLKQERILNAAFEEFAENGYKQASTNRIVKVAGIGKGMLFYYFKSKKELFHYLVDYGINYLITEYLDYLDDSETDFIEKYKKAAQAKMVAHAKSPHIFNFFGIVYINNEVELPDELEKKLEGLKIAGYAKMFNNIDTSLFRDDVDLDKIFKLIHWFLEGYEKELLSRFSNQKLSSIDFDPYWQEFYDYLESLKTIFYK